MAKHQDNGDCPQCNAILDRYPGFHAGMRLWFKAFQKKNPRAHISCAGRGEQDQEACYQKGASKAHWPKSAHNWNCALDFFETDMDPKNIYETKWFETVLKPALTPDIKWYGEPDAPFKELPHVEVANWRDLKDQGTIHLVEGQTPEVAVVTLPPEVSNPVITSTSDVAVTTPTPIQEIIPDAPTNGTHPGTTTKPVTFCQWIASIFGGKK